MQELPLTLITDKSIRNCIKQFATFDSKNINCYYYFMDNNLNESHHLYKTFFNDYQLGIYYTNCIQIDYAYNWNTTRPDNLIQKLGNAKLQGCLLQKAKQLLNINCFTYPVCKVENAELLKLLIEQYDYKKLRKLYNSKHYLEKIRIMFKITKIPHDFVIKKYMRFKFDINDIQLLRKLPIMPRKLRKKYIKQIYPGIFTYSENDFEYVKWRVRIAGSDNNLQEEYRLFKLKHKLD